MQEFLFKNSCAFYNFKTILHRICDERIPILLKGYFTKERHYYLPQEGKLSLVSREFSPKQKVFVVECMPAKGKTLADLIPLINEKGLLELLLANVAVLPQHSENDDMSLLDMQAREEIIKYREMGVTLRCNSSDPEIFSILHTHAATIQEEK